MNLKSNIKIENCVLHYKGKEIPLMSGEFHYWRVLAENWEIIAEKIKEMGFNAIATYIPWNYHELEPEVYDFYGNTSPQRNLDKFLTLMEKAGLYVIIRPGPYIYSEWPFGGVPERCSKFHRLSTEFLAMSKHYINAVSTIIRPHQITYGGSIIICQADNEAYPAIESQGTEMGCFEHDGKFKLFLRNKYNNDINELNKIWQTSYTDFNQCCVYFHESYVNIDLPMAERILCADEYRMRYADTSDFIGTYASEIVFNVASWLRDAGIDIPISANGWSPLYQDFKKMTDIVDICGSDIYPEEFFKYRKIARDNWFYNLDIIKQQEADVSGNNVWSAEFQSGLYPISVVGYLPTDHFPFITLSLMAAGLKGINYYMLVARDNWCHCPINEWGETNEYYEPMKVALKTVKKVEPWNCENVYDISLLTFKPHRVIDPGNFDKCFDALTESDISFCYYNPEAGDMPKTKILLYGGGDWITHAVADKLKEFVENGGTLFAFNRFPHKDEFGNHLDIGFSSPDGARPVNLPINILIDEYKFEIKNVGHMGRKINLFYYGSIDGKPITAILDTGAAEMLVDLKVAQQTTFNLGYIKTIGLGRIIHIGTAANGNVLKNVLSAINLDLSVTTYVPNLLTNILKHKDGRKFIALTNKNDYDVKAEIMVSGKSLSLFTDINKNEVKFLSLE